MLAQVAWAENRNESDAIRPRPLLPKFESQVKPAPGTSGQWWAGSGKGPSVKRKAAQVDDRLFQLEGLLEKGQEIKRKPAERDPSALDLHRRMLRLFQNGRDSAESATETGLFKGVCVKVQAPNTQIPSALAVVDQSGKRYFIPLLGQQFEASDPAFAQKLNAVFRTKAFALYRSLVKEMPLFTPVGRQYPSASGLGMLLERKFADSVLFSHVPSEGASRLFRVRQSFESGKKSYVVQETCNAQSGCFLGDEEDPELLFASPIMHCYYDEEIKLNKTE